MHRRMGSIASAKTIDISLNSICMHQMVLCSLQAQSSKREGPFHLKRPTRELMHSRFIRDWLDYRT